jgi:multimeric flavodoxin WrbA
VHWYQAPASLKLMMDRLVCADGGNPDPTTTRGKDPAAAKALELAGWPYPRHLAGRAFAVVAHGDSQGHEGVRAALAEWLTSIGMIQAGASAAVDTLIGYWEPYATSHDKLDSQPEIFTLVEHAAQSLANMVRALRSGAYRAPDAGLRNPRQK